MAWSYTTRTFESRYYDAGDGQTHYRNENFEIEQTGTSETGATLKLSRHIKMGWEYMAEDGIIELQYGDSTVTLAINGAVKEGISAYTNATTTADITVPSAWAGKTIAWRYKYLKNGSYVVFETYGTTAGIKYEGTFIFDGYGRFVLTMNVNTHVPMKVERTKSPKSGAKTGVLNNKAALYTGDELTIRFSVATGYDGGVKLNGDTVEDGHTLSVSDNITLTAEAAPKATIHLFLGEWATYLFRVYEGSDWGLYQAVIYNGSEWERYY